MLDLCDRGNLSGITIILSNLLLIKVEARVEVRGLARAEVSLEVINNVILIFIY